MFRAQDLPADRRRWAAVFRGVLGSPDPQHGRQLDGLGGGISSLSKACVVGAPTAAGAAAGADVSYTFAAVGVRDDDVDYSANCGNMSAAVGPFAVDSGLVQPVVVPASGTGECVVRIHNTNTDTMIRATFPVVDGEAAAAGDFAIDGVAGTAAPVRLDFLRPGGAKTGRLLPTGNAVDEWSELESGVRCQMTCIDVGNPCVFVEAGAVMSSVPPDLRPEDMEADRDLMRRLDGIRRRAGRMMGLAASEDEVPGSIPKIAMVWRPRDWAASEPGQQQRPPERGDICVRALSVGQPHKAVPVTVALSLAAASRLPGTVVHGCLREGAREQQLAGGLDISHPSGLVKVDVEFNADGTLESAAVFRTARRLMEGTVFWK